MKYLLLIIALSLTSVAQTATTVKPDQLRTAAPEASKPVLLAYTLRGFQAVTLGPGITATQTPTGWVIDAAAPATPKFTLVRTLARLTPAADGSFPLTETGVLKRNGLFMTPGVDYTWAAGKATPKTTWAADDIVTSDEVTITVQ